jgi:hypothetical protein
MKAKWFKLGSINGTKQFLAVTLLMACLSITGCASTVCCSDSPAGTDNSARVKKAKPSNDEVSLNSPDYYSSNDNPYHAD